MPRRFADRGGADGAGRRCGLGDGGKVIKMRTDTVCIHGDTPGAVEIARGVRMALKDAGNRRRAVQARRLGRELTNVLDDTATRRASAQNC